MGKEMGIRGDVGVTTDGVTSLIECDARDSTVDTLTEGVLFRGGSDLSHLHFITWVLCLIHVPSCEVVSRCFYCEPGR